MVIVNGIRDLSVVLNFIVIISDISAMQSNIVMCPSFCVCDTSLALQRVSCIGRHLYSIHIGALPSNVETLDLSNNSISVLNNHELLNAGLSKLKYLNLSTNAINEIGLNAFDGLSELMVLDLSQNHLYYLLSDIFIPAKSLRILRLSKNNFNSDIPKLECPWLTDLLLDSCQISHVPLDTFSGLSYIRTLDLSNNLMIQLDSVALQTLPFLRKLLIERNPWSCNRLTYDLQIYLTHNNIEYQTICTQLSEPKRFEKMVLYNPYIKYEKHRPIFPLSVNIKKNSIMTEQNPTTFTPLIYENITTHMVNTTDKTNFAISLDTILPYWYFISGFILGNACGMFICYSCLIASSTSCRTYRRQGSNDPQRIALLQNWQYGDPTFDESTHQTISRPDTPPPSYRDVVLRPEFYPNS